MKYFINFLLFFLIVSCSKKSNLFSTPIRNTVGALKIVNSDGFLGAVAVGTVYEQTLILKAVGGLNVKNISSNLVTSDPINFKGGTFPGVGGNCQDVLLSGEQCDIVVEYSPQDLASHLAQLTFSFEDDLSQKSYTFNISGDSHPILTFEYGNSYDFGNKFIGSSTNLSIKISNTGRVVAESLTIANLSHPFSYLGGTYPGIGGNCGSRIIPGENCTVIISYSPTNSGQHLQDITLNYLNTNRPETNTLNLIAWGFGAAQLTITSADGNDSFGDVATSHDHYKTFNVSHSGGDVAANLIAINNITAPFSRSGGTCGTTLTIDQGSCTIIIKLNSNLSGPISNGVTFSYFNGLNTISINKTLSAHLKMRPTLLFSTSSINYGVIANGASATQEITISYQPGGEIPAQNITLVGIAAPFTRDGGTCTSTLSSGSCTIILKFSPTSYNSWSQNIFITYNNSIGTVSSSAFILAGKSQGIISYQSSTLNFGTIVTDETRNLTAQINFGGGEAITNLSVVSLSGPFQFTSGSFPGSTSEPLRCQTTIASGNCRIYLTFAPTIAGSYTSTLQLSYFNGINQQTISLNLSGAASTPAILTVSSQDYGTTAINSAKTGSLINIQNGSSVSATSMSVTLPTGFSYRQGIFPGRPGGTCSTSLNGNASCKLDVVFTPTQAIEYAGNISVSYNDGTQARSATGVLNGVGAQDSFLYISSFDQVNFSQRYIGQTPQQITLTIGHGGSSESAIIQNISTSNNHFSLVSHNCPLTLSSGQTCSAIVSFTPQSAGSLIGALTVDYQVNSSSYTASRNLAGTGLSPALLTGNPNELNFGLVPNQQTSELELTITKSGSFSTSASVGIITGTGFIFKNGTYPGTGGSCPTSGSFPASCKVVISFNPTSSTNYSGTFRINYNNGFQTSSLIVNLSGSGQPVANLVFSSANYDFGQIIQTTTSEKTLTITNNGQIDASTLLSSILSSPYQYKGGSYPGAGGNCSDSLAVNASCTLVIVYSPLSTGITSRSLTIGYYNGVQNTSAQTYLTGEALAQAIISVSESNPYNFGSTNPGSYIDKSFNLTNAGSVSGTNIQLSMGSVFNFKGGSFPGTGGNCGTTLNAGNSCQIVISFSPNTLGTFSTSMTLNYNDGLRIQTENKTLNGTSASLKSFKYLLNSFPKIIAKKTDTKFTARQIINHLPHFEGLYQRKMHFKNSLVLYSFNSKLSLVAINPIEHNIEFYIVNHLDQEYQYARYINELQLDLDDDHVQDLVISIHKNQHLIGLDIISAQNGNLLFRLMNHSN
jgi:hypothetical protein